MTLNSTMTRERAIEIAQQAAAHEPTRPSYYTPPDADGKQTFQPHEWVIGAIMNAAHCAVQERFDATAFAEVVEAWVDFPWEGQVPDGLGEAYQRLLNAVGALVNRDEMLKDPEVQRRGQVASVKANLVWYRHALKNAERYNIVGEMEKAASKLAETEAKARELGIEV